MKIKVDISIELLKGIEKSSDFPEKVGLVMESLRELLGINNGGDFIEALEMYGDLDDIVDYKKSKLTIKGIKDAH